MTRFGEERAPLELTKASNKQKVLVCPHCQAGRHCSTNTVGLVCSGCKKYFSADDSLDESMADMINQSKPINTVFTALKGDMERKAYEFKDKQDKERESGIPRRRHEPL